MELNKCLIILILLIGFIGCTGTPPQTPTTTPEATQSATMATPTTTSPTTQPTIKTKDCSAIVKYFNDYWVEKLDSDVRKINKASVPYPEYQEYKTDLQKAKEYYIKNKECFKNPEEEIRRLENEINNCNARLTELNRVYENYRISVKIAENYHKTHTYVPRNIFDCDDMASDIWNQVKTAGVNAYIMVGNLEKSNPTIFECNHAWVMAEIQPFRFAAIEATGGYVVVSEKDPGYNPNYFRGYKFENPKKLKDLLTLLREYEIQMDEYNRAVSQYNALVKKYNAADPITQLFLQDNLNNQANIVNQELEDVNRVVAKINVLIS